MVSAVFLLHLSLYAALCRASLFVQSPTARRTLLFLINAIGVYFIYQIGLKIFLIYFVLVAGQYLLTRTQRGPVSSDLASLAPFMALIAARLIPGGFLGYGNGEWKLAEFLVGLSYMGYRLSYAAKEMRSGTIRDVSFFDYINFAFFVPTLVVGPITRMSYWSKRAAPGFLFSLHKIVWGLVKYLVLATLARRLSFEGQNLGADPIPVLNLVIAAVSYLIYLYANFSGFCDLMLGFSGLAGFGIEENFNHPLAARNIRDFWSRWHVTMNTFMRDTLFFPITKLAMGKLKIGNTASTALSTFCVFFLIGLWHGFSRNYLLFGLLNASGVVFINLYTQWLRKKLSPDDFKAYQTNRFLHVLGIVLTFAFVAATFTLFANDDATLDKILHHLEW